MKRGQTYTGDPCPMGHRERYQASGNCAPCQRMLNLRRYEKIDKKQKRSKECGVVPVSVRGWGSRV